MGYIGKLVVTGYGMERNFAGFGLAFGLLVALSACVPVMPMPQGQLPSRQDAVTIQPSISMPTNPRDSARVFADVIRKMEPAVERECVERRTQPINCDFQFVVDDRPGQEPNAFQTVDNAGRPIIGFTLSLIAEARNTDEIAFVVGHEASHHILGHINRKSNAATMGAVILGGLASAYGADASGVQSAQNLGAQLGARSYSKDWELEADYLGAIVALNAGYSPEIGAQFFARIPDPGDRILGSHPSRDARMAQVQRAVADYRSGRFR